LPWRRDAAAGAVVGPHAEHDGPRLLRAGAVAGRVPRARDQPGRPRIQSLRRHPARRLGSEAPPVGLSPLSPMARSVVFPVAVVVFAVVVLMAGFTASVSAAPEGDVTWAVHVSLAPTWFDPAETPAVITPFMMLYAMHDALVKPMPGNPMTPSLAESWSVSRDGLAYEFALRKGVKFHNGDPVTAEDVKFSLERYRGAAASTLKARVAGVDVIDAQRVRIRLKQPWPDFMTFYATRATGAAWIVPKRYVDRVGDAGFNKAPVGAAPYRVVSVHPGVE